MIWDYGYYWPEKEGYDASDFKLSAKSKKSLEDIQSKV